MHRNLCRGVQENKQLSSTVHIFKKLSLSEIYPQEKVCKFIRINFQIVLCGSLSAQVLFLYSLEFFTSYHIKTTSKLAYVLKLGTN